jgi:mannose-6-phosphate isomerase-like protein (cupin superfamily)
MGNILEGEGEFVVGDNIFPVRSTDVIIVPKDTAFDYSGKMKVLLVHVPAYDWHYDVNLE